MTVCSVSVFFVFFFFKQKTAYEMRISDWSSDVCSSDLLDDSLILNTDYLRIFARSFGLSLLTAVLALTIGFPTALYMAMQPERRRNLLIFLVTIPFWTNLQIGRASCRERV